jgi:hypothetical protein
VRHLGRDAYHGFENPPMRGIAIEKNWEQCNLGIRPHHEAGNVETALSMATSTCEAALLPAFA